MDQNRMTETIRSHPRFNEAGMIATHTGIVRSFSADGSPVAGLELKVNTARLEDIKRKIKSRPGIVEILVETNTGLLKVGDSMVTVMVAGDKRDNVFPALMDAVEMFKSEAAEEREKLI